MNISRTRNNILGFALSQTGESNLNILALIISDARNLVYIYYPRNITLTQELIKLGTTNHRYYYYLFYLYLLFLPLRRLFCYLILRLLYLLIDPKQLPSLSYLISARNIEKKDTRLGNIQNLVSTPSIKN
jgi:hypothetical protein